MTMPALLFEDPVPTHHISIMVSEVVNALAPVDGGLYIDATVGGGGHSEAILNACPGAKVIAFDRDEQALITSSERLSHFSRRIEFVHASFERIAEELSQRNITAVDGMMADLGISTPQLDTAERGMSFRFAGPIDMRMNQTEGDTALELIARLDQDALANVIYEYGEERASRRIARCIKQALQNGELHTTLDLRRAVVRAVGPRRVGGVDPATRTFQALRIAVNDEMGQLDSLLSTARSVLKVDGVLAVISFHSLEDRRVKRSLLDRAVWQRLSSKPIVPSEQERLDNPRSRSAKLRIAKRVAEDGLFEDEVEIDSDSDWIAPESER
jgi:16S rRNA (cytosine1402-N4)-methyltransferase